jgi:subtilisin family serine protease
VAAEAGNAIGLVGIAPEAKILPIRALGASGGSAQSVSSAIQYAVDHGASVINLSLGSPQPSRAIESAINYALNRGVAIVASMGNDGDRGNPQIYPASYKGVIAVGALDPDDRVTPWSDFGPWAAVSAPGYALWSTFPTYTCEILEIAKQNPGSLPPENQIQLDYAALSGTSQAAPVVSGVVALMRSTQKNLKPSDIRKKLMETALPLAPGGFDAHYGAGMVDANKALEF